jgi:hypothetical protein
MGSHAFENKLMPVESVNQQPIGLDMAVASANKVASRVCQQGCQSACGHAVLIALAR